MFKPTSKQIIVDREGKWKERIIRRIMTGIKPVCLSAISNKGRLELLWFLHSNKKIIILHIDIKHYYLKNGKEVKRLVIEVA